MENRYCSSLFAFVCIISAFFIHTTSNDLPSPEDPSSGCVLDFKRYPYQPSGYCAVPKKKVNLWDSIPTNLCCQNALVVLSLALAQRSSSQSNTNIFLQKDEWNKCGGPFPNQPSVSLHSCGFDKFYSGITMCSNLSVSTVQQKNKFQDVLNSCSLLNSSFNGACSNCSKAIMAIRDSLVAESADDTDKTTVCALAVIISVAASYLNDNSSISNLYSCLQSLDVYDPGYYKLKNSVLKAMIAVLIAMVTLIIVVALVTYVGKRKSKRKRMRKSRKPWNEPDTKWSGLYRFSRAEIEDAINYYGEKRNLGRGSAGQVYEGVLPSGQIVAIKHINKSNSTDLFTSEVEGLSRVRHPNLVCLFGCCNEGDERFLVYEYCPSGNLAQHLLRKDCILTWEMRVKILRDCAFALRYLHHYMEGCIVHRDIKLTNILLTEKMEPKLSDFGLAKILGVEESKVFTDVKGTIGYMDPEYMSNAKLTCASDIYSFGIVILQLLSGQKAIVLDLDARDQLTRKAKDAIMGKRPLSDFEDPRLNGEFNRAEFESILQIAVLCVAKSSKGRPTIDVVFDEIDKAWKNIMADMRSNREMSSSATPLSKSVEVIPV